jgi:hypothetical protein
MAGRLSTLIFSLDPGIRYVAANQAGTIVEMEQRADWPSFNPPETDRMEELFVNPLVLEATRRRGEIDLDGLEYVIIRYGKQYQALFAFGTGHVSVGVEHAADIDAVARKVAHTLRVLEGGAPAGSGPGQEA